MDDLKSKSDELGALRGQLKALANRYSIEILQVLSPKTGDIIPNLGWEDIVNRILMLMGYPVPKEVRMEGRTKYQVEYEEVRKRFASGGTLYESMNKIVKADFVRASGAKGKKQRKFMITHAGRLALSAVQGMMGPIASDTEVQRTAKLLLRHKNYVRLLPAQKKFLHDVGDIEKNLIIQMPPGSGKTFLAMIAILIKLQLGRRCLYLSPYLSIIRQVIEEYGELFEELGYSIVRHDGSYRATESELENANLVVAVYETALMGILRKQSWTESFGLVVIDELTELDSWVSRVQAGNLGTDRSVKLDCLAALLKKNAQIITLSARFGNTEEIATWLDATIFRPSVQLIPDEYIVFKKGDTIEIMSCDGAQNDVIQSDNHIEAVLQHLDNYEKKSVLFVVSFRIRTEFLSKFIASRHPRIIDKDVISYIIGQDGNLPIVNRLQETLEKGIAFHHAGLNARVRSRLEEKIKTGDIRTVVSTTGITAGASFPFDCVVLLFDNGLAYLKTRSRYMQIAGRIGEYHLAEYGGRVYLVFEEPSRSFDTPDDIEQTLLHRPLEPLSPGQLYPSLVANLMMRSAVKRKTIKRDKIEQAVVEISNDTFRGSIIKENSTLIKEMASKLFDWFIEEKVIESSGADFVLAKDVKAAVRSGLDVIKYIEIRDRLLNLDVNVTEEDLIDILLQFDVPQSIRPRSLKPTEVEIQLAGIQTPRDWYGPFVSGREMIKKQVLAYWIKEETVASIMPRIIQLSQEVKIGTEIVGGSEMDEGDIDTLVGVCSNLASRLGKYYRTLKKSKLSKRIECFSNQLRHGIKADLAELNLMELILLQEDGTPQDRISRVDARTLFDSGYRSISEVVRKDLDAKKRGLARDRFAKNSGLDLDYAKIVYKSSLEHIRAKFDDDD